MDKNYTVKSVEEYLETVFDLEQKANEILKEIAESNNAYPPAFPLTGLWYRGEKKDYQETSVTPKAFRQVTGYRRCIENNNHDREHCYEKYNLDPYYNEGMYIYYGMHMYFHEALNYMNKASTLEKMIVLQHYGSPTRLLDWTLDPLVALYFAVSECDSIKIDEEKCSSARTDQKKYNDAYVYVLNPRLLNRQLSFGHHAEYPLIADETSINALIRVAHIMTYTDIIKAQYSKRKVIDSTMQYIIQNTRREFRNIDYCKLCRDINIVCNKQHRNIAGSVGYKTCSQKEVTMEYCKCNSKKDSYALKQIIDYITTPIAIFPRWIFKRMQHQKSVFTLHGGIAGVIDKHNINNSKNNEENNKCLPKSIFETIEQGYIYNDNNKIIEIIRIPQECKCKIMRQLYYMNRLGINIYNDDISDVMKYMSEALENNTRKKR